MGDKQINKSFLVTPEVHGGVRKVYSLYKENFLDKTKKGTGPYLIFGFDTEYQKYDDEDEIGNPKDNEILSYQYSCSIISSDENITETEWSGVVLPNGPEVDDRLYLQEFVEFAIGHGINLYPDIKIPREIYLVAHFTRADIPGFKDFKKDKDLSDNWKLENIRNTFANVRNDIEINLSDYQTDEQIKVNLKVRDTIHLAPQSANSLKGLGELLNFEKIKLGDTIEEEKQNITQMKSLLERDWKKFKEYGIRDAEVCTKYIKHIIRRFYKETGKFQLPITLTSIGVSLLTKHWSEQDPPLDHLKMVGKEKIVGKFYDAKTKRSKKYTQVAYQQKLHWHIDFLTEAYHGGRNEQFWFGPCHKDIWNDYDLSSAYPSAMALIGKPNWENIKYISEGEEDKLFDFDPIELVYANVNFKFPEDVRFPVLPVRTESGLLFPRSGNSTTHISEILLAKNLGCDIELVQGRHIPSERKGPNGKRIFRSFLKTCLDNRLKYDKKTVDELFWKEISNSTYGKTAQGLRERRIYDLRKDEIVRLEESKITNPAFASFITAFCRGTLGEIMNNLAQGVNIFSVTTDGFLSNATEKQVESAIKGTLCDYYRMARESLGKGHVIHETKHKVRQPLGWRTRGQATIKPSLNIDWKESPDPDEKIVLAKAGIKQPNKYEKEIQNDDIVEKFFNRKPNEKIVYDQGIGIKNMYKGRVDYVFQKIEKRLSMEFDWKRKPFHVSETPVKYRSSVDMSHLFFSTQPWETVEDFHEMRQLWEDYNKTERHCLKTVNDYEALAEYVEAKLSLTQEAARYLRKKDGDLIRLRRDIIRAWGCQHPGTHRLKPQKLNGKQLFPEKQLTSQQLADLLNDVCFIPCTKFDVDNEKKHRFNKYETPSTSRSHSKLNLLQAKVFPKLVVADFLGNNSKFDIKSANRSRCVLSRRMEKIKG